MADLHLKERPTRSPAPTALCRPKSRARRAAYPGRESWVVGPATFQEPRQGPSSPRRFNDESKRVGSARSLGRGGHLFSVQYLEIRVAPIRGKESAAPRGAEQLPKQCPEICYLFSAQYLGIRLAPIRGQHLSGHLCPV